MFRTRPEIVEVGCWAHARRYFKEAVNSAAVGSLQVLVLIQELYGIAVDPFVYLPDVIDRISTHPMSRIAELTPRKWKRLREAPATRAAA